MLQVKTILFPTDFTVHAEGAFSHAARLAHRFDAAVHVLNVVAPHRPEVNNPMNFLPLEQEAGDEQFHFKVDKEGTISGESRTQDDLHVHYQQVRRASPVTAILEYADAHEIDLIVMGTRGRGGIDRFLSGSVAEEVVRLATCPILTVRAEEEFAPPQAVHRVLVPLDFSGQAPLQIAHAAALADAYKARIDLLHVIEEGVFPTVYGIDPDSVLTAGIEVRARKALRELPEEAGRPNLSFDAHVVIGHAARDIVDFAREHDAGMIVMATHGRTGLQRFFLGSVAEKVVRTAPCPVFTVRSFGKSLLAPQAAQEIPDERALPADDYEDD